MAKCLALCISLCLLVFFNACLARQQQSQSGQNECQLNRLQAREPDNLMESEAGLTESWDYNQNDFQCAGVAAMRRTIEPNGLHLPSYTNAPQLIYVVEGRGVLGVVFPGCPETFEESDQQSQQQQQYQQSRRQGRQQHGQSRFEEQDRHQRIRYVREGDVIALPAGVAYWSYNDGDQPLVAVAILDTSNDQNQLDQNPRRFYLAGNPQSEFDQQQQVQRQRQRHQSRQGQDQSQRQREQGRGQRGQSEDEQDREQRQREQRRQQQQHEGRKSSNNNNNIFSGFDTNLLAEALNVDEETVRRLQGQNDDDRNQIVRVRERLDFLSPLSERYGSREEREREQRQRERQEEEREQEQRYQRGGQDNSLEVRGCRQRIRENIGDPSRADVFTPQGGRISTLNSENLPMLRWIRLSAERGFLYNNAIYSPHWNLRAHEVYYVIRGNARVQVVNHNGEAILDDEVREGQLFIVPQNHAVLQKASNEGYEFINFRTEDNAPINTLAGQTSALRALPDEVLSNAFQISREQAQNLKYNRQESALLSASSSRRREIMA